MLHEQALQSVTALHDLPHLVAALGHEPLWEPVGGGALDLGGKIDTPHDAAIVGRLGGFTWYAIATDDPARSTPRIARRLVERGRVCGVFGLSAASRRLVVSVAFNGTPTLEVNLDQPSRLATSCLARIGSTEAGGTLGIASRTAEALSGGEIGRRFFNAFRTSLDRFTDALPPRIPERQRHELALLQLTRVLFLYFIQAKGWLDGSEHFLRERVDDCLFHRRSIHRTLLLPLFFGTLNRAPPDRRRGALAFGRIPFLNGGLFEPHRLERLHRPDLANVAWRDAFDTLFERYHFTIQDSAAGSIAPDMLGLVFEGVMDPDARKQSGTFYTPATLVRMMVDAALAGYTAGRLHIEEGEALRRLEAGDRSAVQLLDTITILDPAAGSGAFLLGALDRLMAFQAAAGIVPDARRIVSRNLFGVDQNPAAVQLGELRLWLAVIGADPDGSPETVEPLPNLDACMRQGDTLADPLHLALRHPLRSARPAKELVEARRAAATASGMTKRSALKQLRSVELTVASERLDAAITYREADARGLVASGRAPTLFGDRQGLGRAARRELQQVRRDLGALRSARRRLHEANAVPSFDFDTHFGDVTANGGFDVVVGNPPWVRAEQLSMLARNELASRFRWWRAGGGRGYRHQPDLSVAFLERGWELTKAGGVLAMLVPAKLATAGYGAAARATLSERGTLLALADLTQDKHAVFEATTYPLAIVVRAEAPPAGHRPRAGLRPSAAVPLPRLPSSGAPWILHSGNLQEALDRFRAFPILSDAVRIQLGVKTGANHLFLMPPPEVEADLVRPAMHGRDVRAFRSAPSGRIIWTHDANGHVLSSIPSGAARHFARHAAALRARADDTGAVSWQVFRAASGRAAPRVVWADLAPRLEASCLVGARGNRCIPLNSCYVATCASAEGAHALTAWLNSTWIRAAARATADPANGGYARFNARAVGSVPLPHGALGDAMLSALGRRGFHGEMIQEELDGYVANQLELSHRDREVLAEVVGVGSPRRR